MEMDAYVRFWYERNDSLHLVLHRKGETVVLCLVNMYSSVAVPGCLSRIRIFEFSHPGSRFRVKKIPDPGSGSASKNLSFSTQKIVSKLSEI